MKIKSFNHVLALAILSAGFLAPMVQAQQAVDLSNELWRAANKGDEKQTLEIVDKIQKSHDARQLLAYYNMHLAHEKARNEANLNHYNESMAEAKKAMEEGKVIVALNHLLAAIDDIGNKEIVLGNDDAKAIIQEATKIALAEEKKGDLIQATTLYSQLASIHDDKVTFVDEVERVGRHLRLLRMYAPEESHKLFVKRANARGEEAPPEFEGAEDAWKKEVKGSRPTMLRLALNRAFRHHVDARTSYRQMIAGGVNAMRVFLDTPGLETTFVGLKKDDQRLSFIKTLDEIDAQIADKANDIRYADFSDMLDSLINSNAKTIGLPEEVLIHELGVGFMSTLDDYSSIIWPYQLSVFQRSLEGEFSGVGIQIQMKNGEITVVSPLEGTPAHEAGIKAQEAIVGINGKPTKGLTLDQAVEQITGKQGTSVTLGIKDIRGNVRQVPLVRRTIKMVSVKGWDRKKEGGWNYHIDKEKKIGYLRMTSFSLQTPQEMDAAIKQMKAEGGLNGLILDLRFNPGGILDSAVRVTDGFIKEGVIVSAKGRNTTRAATSKATLDSYGDFPMIVLINDGSASASEIVSGALQDHNRALIVGENSFGKGSVQDVIPIYQRQAYLKLTIQYYMLPNGRIIHRLPNKEKWGIQPNYTVKMTAREVNDMLTARSHLDVLRDANAKVDLPATTQPMSDDEKEAWYKLHPKDTDAYLTSGLDPQLEAALLLMKARLIGDSEKKTAQAD